MDPVSKAQATPQNRRFLKGGHSPDIGKHTRFNPGQSGNPGGRPKHSISAIYRKWLKKARNRQKIEEFLDATIEGQSKMAGVLLIREMTERDEGKVIETVDMNVTGSIQLANIIEQRRKKRGNADSRES
jgi:hypothetical protein